jgi:hypothetical protein
MIRAALLFVLGATSALAQADGGAVAASGGAPLAAAGVPERPTDPRELFVWELKYLPRVEVLDKSEAVINQLGTYRYKMVKQERVDGNLLEAQEILTTVQESPFAMRMDYVRGPGKGRVVLYNTAIKTDRFRVREAGFLSIVGAIWIDVDSGFAKAESRHTVKDGGLGNLNRRFRRDHLRGIGEGGFVEKHEGWNNAGAWCALYLSPNGGKGYDSFSTRICSDPLTRYPTKVEGFDDKGRLLERYEFSNIEKVELPKNYFTLEGAGL